MKLSAKRLTDICFCAAISPLAIPLIALLSIVILLVDGRPVFFFQLRTGQLGTIFRMVKFRTMTTTTTEAVDTTTDAARITKLGQFLRSSSLDELPELWNILKGDMTLVGPRPLLPEYTPLYSHVQARRLEVKPGLTGLAQVSGRNALTWEERFELDVWYVDNRNWRLDIKILATTLAQVFRRRGISSDNSATMHKFTGSSHDL